MLPEACRCGPGGSPPDPARESLTLPERAL
jgi:hypothetical protein